MVSNTLPSPLEFAASRHRTLKVPCREVGHCHAVLEKELQRCLDGHIPVLAVVAVIGSLDEGAVDDVRGIVQLRKQFQEKVRQAKRRPPNLRTSPRQDRTLCVRYMILSLLELRASRQNAWLVYLKQSHSW